MQSGADRIIITAIARWYFKSTYLASRHNTFTSWSPRMLAMWSQGYLRWVQRRFICSSKFNIFTRKLLDSWVYDVCPVGIPFRGSFSSLSRSCYASSASLHAIGQHGSINRQRSNEAFNQYVKTLQFPNYQLTALFSCKNTHNPLWNEKKTWWNRHVRHGNWNTCWTANITSKNKSRNYTLTKRYLPSINNAHR